MATSEQIINLALSQVGYKESPAGSNRTKYGAWYGMDGQPWCDMFISWLAAQVGQQDIGKFAYCPYHVQHFKSRGQWHDREEIVKPGDVVFFGNGSQAVHVGLVIARNGSISIDTVEGNTSQTSNDNGGAVMRRNRTYGRVGSSWYIMGFGRPNYSQGGTMGWQQDEMGWWYREADGSYPQNEWKKLDAWYYFNSKGYAITGWQKIEGFWYYFDRDCRMKTGWLMDDDHWFYLSPAEKPVGHMLENCLSKIDGKYFAFNPSGEMFTKINGGALS